MYFIQKTDEGMKKNVRISLTSWNWTVIFIFDLKLRAWFPNLRREFLWRKREKG